MCIVCLADEADEMSRHVFFEQESHDGPVMLTWVHVSYHLENLT